MEDKLHVVALADQLLTRSMLGVEILPRCESNTWCRQNTLPQGRSADLICCRLIWVSGINPLVSTIPTRHRKTMSLKQLDCFRVNSTIPHNSSCWRCVSGEALHGIRSIPAMLKKLWHMCVRRDSKSRSHDGTGTLGLWTWFKHYLMTYNASCVHFKLWRENYTSNIASCLQDRGRNVFTWKQPTDPNVC